MKHRRIPLTIATLGIAGYLLGKHTFHFSDTANAIMLGFGVAGILVAVGRIIKFLRNN